MFVKLEDFKPGEPVADSLLLDAKEMQRRYKVLKFINLLLPEIDLAQTMKQGTP